jgi:hypothetical protein
VRFPGRYLDPGAGIRQALLDAHAADPRFSAWLAQVNPNAFAHPPTSPAAAPWLNNCGDVSRRFVEAFQGAEVEPAWGDPELGETRELWTWAGLTPDWGFANPLDQAADGTLAPAVAPADFTAGVWTAIGAALSGEPVGSAAIVRVGWDRSGVRRDMSGAHYFTAVVTEDGVQWVDAQVAETSPWPPGYGVDVHTAHAIVRAPGGSWKELSYAGAGTAGGDGGGTLAGGHSGVVARDGLRGAALPGRVPGGADADADRGAAVRGAERAGGAGPVEPAADPGRGLGDAGGAGRGDLTPAAAPDGVETGIDRPAMEPGRYVDPGADARAALLQALADDPSGASWLPREFDEMWARAGVQPAVGLYNPEGVGQLDAGDFTARAWETLGASLASEPVGTVAVLAVRWEDPALTRGRGRWALRQRRRDRAGRGLARRAERRVRRVATRSPIRHLVGGGHRPPTRADMGGRSTRRRRRKRQQRCGPGSRRREAHRPTSRCGPGRSGTASW